MDEILCKTAVFDRIFADTILCLHSFAVPLSSWNLYHSKKKNYINKNKNEINKNKNEMFWDIEKIISKSKLTLKVFEIGTRQPWFSHSFSGLMDN